MYNLAKRPTTPRQDIYLSFMLNIVYNENK